MNQNTCAQIANSVIYKHNVTGVTMRHWCNTVDCNTSDRDTSDIHALYITAKFIHFISTRRLGAFLLTAIPLVSTLVINLVLTTTYCKIKQTPVT